MQFATRLRQERLRRHLSQEALAEALGVSPRSVIRWEQGKVVPQASVRLQLIHFFGLASEELFAEHEVQPPSSLLWNVPFLRNPCFTGREDILFALHSRLANAQSVALVGLGGIGKTQIAVEYAYRYAQDYTSIFWLRAETSEYLRSDLIAIADRLDLPERGVQDQSRIVRAVHHWLTSHHGWLLIVDNVQEIEAVKGLLPPARNGSLLFTIRRPTLGTFAEIIRVEQMTQEEGIHFLLRRAKQKRHYAPLHRFEDAVPASEYAAAEQLFAMMDGLPLALDQAGAYIEKTQSGFADFLHLFQKYPMQLLHVRETYEEHSLSVAKTFLLAFEQLQQTNPTAADLLTLYCMLPLDGIPEELVTEANACLGPLLSVLGADTFLYHQALQDLLSYSFVQRSPETRRITLHRLVQLVIREYLAAEVQQQWAMRLLRAANAIFPQWQEYVVIPEDNVDDWPRNQRLLPLVFACEQLIEQYQAHMPEAVHLLARAAHYLRLRAQYRQAEALCHRAMQLNEVIHSSDHIDTAMVLFVHVPIYYDLGRYAEAEGFCRRALALYEQFLGAEHSVTIAAANFLAELSRLCGKNREAEVLFSRVLAFYEKYGKSTEIASPLFSLANLYRTQKRFEEAESLLLRSLAIREQEDMGLEHFHTAGSLRGLALLYTEWGCYEKAEPLYQRALAIYERTMAPEHPHIAITLMHFGQLYFLQQRYHEAEALYLRSLALQERIYAPEHTHFISLLTQLGQLASAQKRYSEAEKHLKRALSLAEHALVPQDAQVAAIRSELFRLDALQQSLNSDA